MFTPNEARETGTWVHGYPCAETPNVSLTRRDVEIGRIERVRDGHWKLFLDIAPGESFDCPTWMRAQRIADRAMVCHELGADWRAGIESRMLPVLPA